MKATLNGVVLAEADDDAIIRIEGNAYFPPESITPGVLEASPTPYTCPWKGACQHFTVHADGQVLADRAWSYPEPYQSGIERVGKNFANYVAFWKEVHVG